MEYRNRPHKSAKSPAALQGYFALGETLENGVLSESLREQIVALVVWEMLDNYFNRVTEATVPVPSVKGKPGKRHYGKSNSRWKRRRRCSKT